MSVTIIDKTVQAPIFVWRPKPTFRTTKEKDRWWDSEFKKWHDGADGLTGDHYHYLTQQFIKHRQAGGVTRPDAREVDILLFEFMRDCEKKKHHGGVIKTRGFGFSSVGGAKCNSTAIKYPGTNSIITSKETGAIREFFQDKVYIPFTRYDDELVGQPMKANENFYKGDQPIYQISKNLTKGYCSIRINVNHLVDGKIVSDESQITGRETASADDKATGFSGMGAKFGFFDEFPLHKRRESLMESSKECFMHPTTKALEGFLLWGGTVEHTLTPEQLYAFQKLVEECRKPGSTTDILFIPYWWSVQTNNGRVDMEAAKRWHDEQMELFAKDAYKLRAFLKNNPRDEKDVFDITATGAFEEDVTAMIKLRREEVLKADIPLIPTAITKFNGIQTSVVKESPILIMEPPRPNVSYCTVVDSMAVGTDQGSLQGSDYVALVMKMFDPNGGSFSPVAMYCERPNKLETAYWNTVYLSEYYEKGSGARFEGIMAEASNSTEEHFTNFLNTNGYGRYIMYRKDLSGKGYVNINKSFQPVNNWTQDYQYRAANIFLRKGNIHSMSFLPLLEELLFPKEKNADKRSAWLMFFVAFPDINKTEEVKVQRSKRIITIVTDAMGRRISKAIVKNSQRGRERVTKTFKFGN